MHQSGLQGRGKREVLEQDRHTLGEVLWRVACVTSEVIHRYSSNARGLDAMKDTRLHCKASIQHALKRSAVDSMN